MCAMQTLWRRDYRIAGRPSQEAYQKNLLLGASSALSQQCQRESDINASPLRRHTVLQAAPAYIDPSRRQSDERYFEGSEVSTQAMEQRLSEQNKLQYIRAQVGRLITERVEETFAPKNLGQQSQEDESLLGKKLMKNMRVARKISFVDKNIKNFVSVRKQRKMRDTSRKIKWLEEARGFSHDIAQRDSEELEGWQKRDLSCLFEAPSHIHTKDEKQKMLLTLTQGLHILKKDKIAEIKIVPKTRKLAKLDRSLYEETPAKHKTSQQGQSSGGAQTSAFFLTTTGTSAPSRNKQSSSSSSSQKLFPKQRSRSRTPPRPGELFYTHTNNSPNAKAILQLNTQNQQISSPIAEQTGARQLNNISDVIDYEAYDNVVIKERGIESTALDEILKRREENQGQILYPIIKRKLSFEAKEHNGIRFPYKLYLQNQYRQKKLRDMIEKHGNIAEEDQCVREDPWTQTNLYTNLIQEEKKKKLHDLKSRSSVTNCFYDALSLAPQSKNKIRRTFRHIFPQECRFQNCLDS